MEVDDEIAHLGVVDGHLRLGLPGGVGGGVVRVETDDLDVVEILEGVVLEIDEFAADHEMEQLLRGTIWHGSLPGGLPGKAVFDKSDRSAQGKGRSRKCATMLACRSRPAATSTPCVTSRRL